MDINSILGYNNVAAGYTSTSSVKKTEEKTSSASTTTDSFVKSADTGVTAGTYTADIVKTETTGKDAAEAMAEKLDEKTEEKTYAYDSDKVSKLIAESDAKISQFKEMLDTLLKKQAERNGAKSEKDDATSDLFKNMTVGEDGMVHFNREDVEAAGLGTFDENGYWGAEQTAQRIFDMAVSFAGNDSNLLSKMKDAIYEGFSQVEDIFGGEGKLPDVSYKTRDRIDSLFKEYEDKLSGKTTSDDTEVKTEE